MPQKKISSNSEKSVSIKGTVKIPTVEDMERLKETLVSIYRELYDEIGKENFNKIIRSNKVPKGKMLGNRDPEEFTRKRVVEKLLFGLGYSEDNFKESTAMSTNKNIKRVTDFNLEINIRNEKNIVFVEVEPLNKKWEMMGKRIEHFPSKFDYEKKEYAGIEQVFMWLNYRDNAGKYGIATNGFIWQKAKLVQECKQNSGEVEVKEYIKFFKQIDLKDIFKKIDYEQGYQKISHQEKYDIDKKLKDFYAQFSKKTIIRHFKTEELEIYLPEKELEK